MRVLLWLSLLWIATYCGGSSSNAPSALSEANSGVPVEQVSDLRFDYMDNESGKFLTPLKIHVHFWKFAPQTLMVSAAKGFDNIPLDGELLGFRLGVLKSTPFIPRWSHPKIRHTKTGRRTGLVVARLERAPDGLEQMRFLAFDPGSAPAPMYEFAIIRTPEGYQTSGAKTFQVFQRPAQFHRYQMNNDGTHSLLSEQAADVMVQSWGQDRAEFMDAWVSNVSRRSFVDSLADRTPTEASRQVWLKVYGSVLDYHRAEIDVNNATQYQAVRFIDDQLGRSETETKEQFRQASSQLQDADWLQRKMSSEISAMNEALLIEAIFNRLDSKSLELMSGVAFEELAYSPRVMQLVHEIVSQPSEQNEEWRERLKSVVSILPRINRSKLEAR